MGTLAAVSWDVPPRISQLKNWSVTVQVTELDTVVYAERTKVMHSRLQMHAVGEFTVAFQYCICNTGKLRGKQREAFKVGFLWQPAANKYECFLRTQQNFNVRTSVRVLVP